MVKGKLERRYKLVHNGRELSQGLLSEAGKYDAFQILVQKFDEAVPGAIDPDEVEVIDMSLQENRDFTYLLACIFLQKGGKVCVPLLHDHIQHILVLHCFVVEEPHNPVFTL